MLTIRPASSDSSPKHPNQKNPDNYSTNSVYLRTFARRKQSVGLSLVHYYIVKEESPGNAEHPTS